MQLGLRPAALVKPLPSTEQPSWTAACCVLKGCLRSVSSCAAHIEGTTVCCALGSSRQSGSSSNSRSSCAAYRPASPSSTHDVGVKAACFGLRVHRCSRSGLRPDRRAVVGPDTALAAPMVPPGQHISPTLVSGRSRPRRLAQRQPCLERRKDAPEFGAILGERPEARSYACTDPDVVADGEVGVARVEEDQADPQRARHLEEEAQWLPCPRHARAGPQRG